MPLLTSLHLLCIFFYHRQSLLKGFQREQVEDDIHMKLMWNYTEVPGGWLVIIVVEVGVSVTIFIDPAILTSTDFRFGMWWSPFGHFCSLLYCPLSMSYHLDSYLW